MRALLALCAAAVSLAACLAVVGAAATPTQQQQPRTSLIVPLPNGSKPEGVTVGANQDELFVVCLGGSVLHGEHGGGVAFGGC